MAVQFMNPDPARIFQGTAWYYRRYRRPYPAQLINDIVDYFHLNGSGRLLDLGCGTGELTVPLSAHIANAVGVDPSSDMLEEAKARAGHAGAKNIRWVQGRAEDISSDLAPLRLTTAGVSFHWMRQGVVLAKVYELTAGGGGMAIIGDISPVLDLDKTENWKLKRKNLIEKYLGPKRRAGEYLHEDIMIEKRPYAELIAESPFHTFEGKTYSYTTERNIDQIVGFLYSTSYANLRLFGDRANEFERELRSELSRLVPSGKFIEGGKAEVFLLQKR